MDGNTAFGFVLVVAAAIVMGFSVSIVMPISGLLGILLIIFSVWFGLGAIAAFVKAYRS